MATFYPDSLDSSLGTETANTYCDLEYADSYFANHFSSAKSTTWSLFTEAQKIQVLIQACWTIEQVRFTIPNDGWHSSIGPDFLYTNAAGQFQAYSNRTYESTKYFFYQVLQFPRNKDVTSGGQLYIPDRVMKAQCEQAIYLTSFDDSAIANTLQGVALDTIQVDKIKLTQEYTSGVRGTALAPMALEYLKPYVLWTQRLKRS
jgi:hypothetical protein